MPDNLPANWAAHWAADPHREVLRAPGGLRLSGAEFADRTAALAGRYAAAGLTPGDRVLMSAAPSVDLVLAHVAALRYGLTVVPANTGYTAPELAPWSPTRAPCSPCWTTRPARPACPRPRPTWRPSLVDSPQWTVSIGPPRAIPP